MKTKQDQSDVARNSRRNSSELDEGQELCGPESMTNRAYTRIRADIISGVLAPERKLKIEELRQIYNLGPSPIREALSSLTSEYLVERLDQRGFRVARISLVEFDELLKTRCWLEERALREAIANGDKEWEEQVLLAAYRLSRVPRLEAGSDCSDNHEWEQRHRHFHKTLITACGSKILLRLCEMLYDQNIRYRQLSNIKAYPARDINAEHGVITDAVLARNADLATELLIAHYTETGKHLKESLVLTVPTTDEHESERSL
ncbi:MAG: FCD domain-containing protein [Desulfuromusa sp.]|nr:FCD domain-containing protein [Desulfuromusa sp.]